MKKYLIGTSLLLSSFISPSFAEEAKNFYLSIGGGIAFPSDIEGDATLSGTKIDAKFPTDDPFFYSVGIGKEINDWRLEFNYAGTTVSTNSITATTGGSGATASITPNLEADAKIYMLYGYKNFSNEGKFTPYVGLGLGAATLETKDTTATVLGTDLVLKGSSETVFSYSLKGGADYEIAENTNLYTEATYQNFSSFTVSEPGYVDTNYDSINYFGISAGLRFKF